MKINVNEFREKLDQLMPGLSGRSPVKDVKHFAFLGEEIVTYNDQVCIGIPFLTDFICTAPADELLSILSSITDAEIDISLQKGKIIFQSLITNDNAQLLTPGESELMEMINSLEIPQQGWKQIPSEFLTAIGLCAFSTSKDMTQGALNCVHIDGDTICSSDTFRISAYRMKEPMNAEEILIPVVAVKDLIRYNITKFLAQKNWIHFQEETGLIFSARILADDYPDILNLLNLEPITTVEIPRELKEVLKSIDVFSRGDFETDKKVKITVGDNFLICRAENQTGFVEKNLKISYKGETISFYINPVFFAEILEKSVIMQIDKQKRKALFSSESFKHLMALSI